MFRAREAPSAPIEVLRRKIEDQHARLADRARRLQEFKNTDRELRNTRRQVDQLSRLTARVIRRYFSSLPLPPPELRLHVGTNSSDANFWAQGFNSAERVLEVFGETPSSPVLDWGCGSGRTLLWLQRLPAWRAHYHGCDVDAAAIAWLAANSVRNVSACQDRPPLPYPDRFFGGLYGFSVLTHIPPDRHREWYTEIRRVLQAGGVAYLTTQGDAIVNDSAYAIPAECKGEFERDGCTYVRNESHYKDAALVSEAYTRKSLQGLLVVEHYKGRGYQNMDAFLVRRTD
jgi:SAM-dependent methyltransferase